MDVVMVLLSANELGKDQIMIEPATTALSTFEIPGDLELRDDIVGLMYQCGAVFTATLALIKPTNDENSDLQVLNALTEVEKASSRSGWAHSGSMAKAPSNEKDYHLWCHTDRCTTALMPTQRHLEGIVEEARMRVLAHTQRGKHRS